MKSPLHCYIVFVGRFQPFHEGHLRTVRLALTQCQILIIVLGSHGAEPDIRNPWSTAQRQEMILGCLNEDEKKQVRFLPITDRFCEELWVSDVTQGVQLIIDQESASVAKLIKLIGHEKDQTSYYLKLFPQWQLIETGNYKGLNSTALRGLYFLPDPSGTEPWAKDVPAAVVAWLRDFRQTSSFLSLQRMFLS